MLADFPGYEEYQKAEPVDPEVDGIQNISPLTPHQSRVYNLAGQQVYDSFKGVIIKNGKIYLK